MAVNPDEDTELWAASTNLAQTQSNDPQCWRFSFVYSNDALRAHGIIPPKPKRPKTPSPPASPTLATALAQGSPTLDELDLLADEGAADSDEERLIDKYKRQRLNEMKKEAKANRRRFGSVIPISRADYTREVTETSKAEESDEEEKVKEEGETWKGTGVVCFLYQEGK